jgi:hypothetical protein
MAWDQTDARRRKNQLGSTSSTTDKSPILLDDDSDLPLRKRRQQPRPWHYFRRILANTRNRWILIALVAFAAALLYAGESQPSSNVGSFSSFLLEESISLPDDPRAVLLDIALSPYLYSTVQSSLEKYRFHKGLSPLDRLLNPDYGGLQMTSLLMMPDFHRHIQSKDANIYGHERRSFLYAIDYDLDSDYDSFEDRDFDPHGCVPPKWKYMSHPNCNAFHELSLELPPDLVEQDFNIKYLGHGYYRETYLFTRLGQRLTAKGKHSGGNEHDEPKSFVLKHLLFKDRFSFNQKNEASIHKEALVMDILSSSRPRRTSNVYGYCSTSIFVEAAKELTYDIVPELEIQEERGRIAQKKLDKMQTEDVYPLNDFTVPDKLKIALSMAEALAGMHGHPGGSFAHDDFHPGSLRF